MNHIPEFERRVKATVDASYLNKGAEAEVALTVLTAILKDQESRIQKLERMLRGIEA